MAFRPSGRKRIGLKLADTKPVPLTSLIDLFTNVLIFLLMSYSPVELNIAPSEFLHMPNSISTKLPIQAVVVTVAKNSILVEGEPVALVDQNFDVVGLKDPSELLINNLYIELKNKREKLEKRAKLYKREAPEKVLIQADRDVPYKLLMKVLKTAGQAGFSQMVFLTYQTGEKG